MIKYEGLFLQIAGLVINPGVQSPPNGGKDQIQWI